jgi:hypothetical protein
MAKISNFAIGIVLISLFTIIFVGLMGDISSQYGVDYDNSSTLSNTDQLQNITNKMDEIKESVSSLDSDPGITDILGNLLSNGYKTLLTTKDMFAYFFSMLIHSTDELQFKGAGYIVSAISTIVLIVIIVGIFMSVLVKREV